MYARFRLNALSLKLGSIGAVLSAFALSRVAPVDAAAWAALTVVLAAAILSRLRGRPIPLPRDPVLLALGLLDGAGSLCLFASLERLGPVPVALLGGLGPVFAAPLAFVVLGERLRASQVLVGAAAVAGALLFSWHEGAAAGGPGLALACGATLAYTAGNLVAKLALRRHDACAVLGASRLASLAVVLAFGAATGHLGRGPLDPAGAALVAAGALLGSFAALLLFYEALRHDSLSVSTVIRSAGPVATAACAWPFFPVALTPLNVVGGAVLLGSVAWLSLGPGRPRSRA